MLPISYSIEGDLIPFSNVHLEIAENIAGISTAKNEHLDVAKTHCKEAIRIYMILYGAAYFQTIEVVSTLSEIESHLRLR